MGLEAEHSTVAYAAKIERSDTGERQCFRRHQHHQLEMILVESGEYLFKTLDREERFAPGDVFMVNSNEDHEGVCCSRPGRYYYVQLSLSRVPRGLSKELDRLVEDLEVKKIMLLHRVPKAQAEETGLFEQSMAVAHAFLQPGGYNEFNLLVKTLQVFQTIAEHRLYTVPELQKQSTDPFVQEVAKYIDVHYAEELCLEDVARRWGYEAHYFCSLFKKHFHTTFTRYLRRVRIKKFQSHPNLNLQTIADCAADVGFSNYSYFYRCFRSNQKCSPREYLTRNRK